MEFVEGINLREFLIANEGKIPIDQVKNITKNLYKIMTKIKTNGSTILLTKYQNKKM